MRIACVVVPHFQVEVERLDQPALGRRPVVVGGAPEDRREVLDCSPEAMVRGVRVGMALREALSRCAEAAFVEAHPERYRAVTQRMVEALLEISALVEPTEPGVIYVGIDPADQRPTSQPGVADPLEVQVGETIRGVARRASGLPVRVGIADGKFAAYVAALPYELDGIHRSILRGSLGESL